MPSVPRLLMGEFAAGDHQIRTLLREGLNWQMFQLSGYRFIWQEGSVPGFNSYCALCPELGLGIVVLANELDRDSSSKMTDMVKKIVRAIDPLAADLP